MSREKREGKRDKERDKKGRSSVKTLLQQEMQN